MAQFSNALRYQGQAGALYESISDVFALLTEQHHRQQNAGQANWLIGNTVGQARLGKCRKDLVPDD